MKKIFAVFLSLFVIGLCFAGCSSDNNENNTVEIPLEITYDSAYSDYDASVFSAYNALCSAVINYEDSVRFNLGMLDAVIQLYYTSFPLSVLAVPAENSDGSGVSITYEFTEEEHKARVNEFAEKINAIKDECFGGTVNKTVYALNLYQYVSSHFVSGEAESCYDTVINGAGTDFTYARMFEYLLQQAGIPSYYIIATDAAGVSTAVSAAELDGCLYYFDTAMEHYTSGGTLLRYFGMTSADIAEEGLTNLIYSDQRAAANADDLRFDTCRVCTAWEISGASLLITIGNGDIVEIEL